MKLASAQKENDDLRSKINALEERIGFLEEENSELRKKLKEAEKKLIELINLRSWYSPRMKKKDKGKGKHGKLSPEELKKRNLEKTNSGRGAKKGHQGHNRARREADQHIHLKLEYCPHCHNSDLGKQSERYSRQIVELITIPLIQTIEYHFYQAHCPNCQKTASTGIDNIPELNSHQYIGNRLKAFIGLLRFKLNQSIDQVYFLINFLSGFDIKNPLISKGEIAETYLEAVDYGEGKYQEILNNIRGSPHSHWDETGLSCGGNLGYVWLGKSDKEVYYQVELSRGSKIIEEILGEDYRGILIADFYRGYRSTRFLIQRCWIHLLRKVDKLFDNDPSNKELYYLKEKLWYMYNTFTDKEFRRELEASGEFREASFKEYRDWMKNVINHLTYRTKGGLRIVNGLKRHFDELFIFLKYPEIPPHNNPAENSIRPIVRFRDNCNCVQSQRGMKALSIGKSLIETSRLREENEFQFLLNLISTNH